MQWQYYCGLLRSLHYRPRVYTCSYARVLSAYACAKRTAHWACANVHRMSTFNIHISITQGVYSARVSYYNLASPWKCVCSVVRVLFRWRAVMSCEEEEESSMDEDEDMPGLESVSSSEVKCPLILV